MPDDVMQKPSLGFDLVKRFSGKTRDIGVLAVQARLAYDQEGEHKLEPQLYNAYFRLKTKSAGVWIGHNRPALGLSSVLDSHALLLPAPAMLGFGFDRDWGLGLERDFGWGGAAASLTAGSGMPLYFKGNFLPAARVSKGVPARDNYSVGLSLARGNVLETMGYTLVGTSPWLGPPRRSTRPTSGGTSRTGPRSSSAAARAPASSSSSGAPAWPCSTRAGSRSRPSRSWRGGPGLGIIPSAPD